MEAAPASRFMPGHDGTAVSGVIPLGASLSPLEIGLQAIQPWPYHAGLAARHRERLWSATAFLACSCPLALSRPGKPVDPRVE